MSSSYSSLDGVLSHLANFTVHRFSCVYLCIFCVKTPPQYDLLYNVFGGMSYLIQLSAGMLPVRS